jgi:predicted O-methyltransferase YrrM
MAASLLARSRAKLGRLAHRRRETPAELARMHTSQDAGVRCIARACEATLVRRIAPSETVRIDAIESLRRELLASREPVDAAAPADARDDSLAAVCRTASKPPLWTRFLFHLIREQRPDGCLELGTCLGISAAYQSAALDLNGAGSLVSLEGSTARAARAREHLRRLELARARVVEGRFQDTLAGVLAECGKLDYAFVDGHHDEDATLAYFDAIAAHAAPGALIVLDDIRWSPGMERAWLRLRVHPAVAASVDMFLLGICVLGEPAADDARFTVSLG